MKHQLTTYLFLLFLSPSGIGEVGGVFSTEDFEIHLAGATEREEKVAEVLVGLSHKHDLSPWVFTNRVRIETGVIPHSHPILTLHTRHVADPDQLLALFLHEQIHWFLGRPENIEAQEAALSEFREMYPRVPHSRDGGAADKESTYLHLLVNWLEFDAVSQLLGIDKAQEVMEEKAVYQWIYGRVIKDNKELESIVKRHGLKIADERR